MEKKKKYMLLGVIGTLLLLTGVSYAYWRLTLTQTGTNQISSSCLEVSLTNEQNDIHLEKAAPISDEEGLSLTPYTFTITNTCNDYATYRANLEILNTTTLNEEYVKVALSEDIQGKVSDHQRVDPTLDNVNRSYLLKTGYLNPNESITYNLRLWMDEDVTVEDDAMNKVFHAKVTVIASYMTNTISDYELCVANYGAENPQCQIIASTDTTGKCPEVNEEGQILVSGPETTESLVCSAPDDYGNSYYFRGDVENNWVKFADAYWRIVRVNGDGSIRMIYAGDADAIDNSGQKETILQNGYDDSYTFYTLVGGSVYNENNNDNAYVGYMYGTPVSSTYNETHANINDSTIKQYIDQWYQNNIVYKGYNRYVSDTLFCNDRTLLSDPSFEKFENLGFGANGTAYRWAGDPSAAQSGADGALTYPNFQCTQKNDRFTVSDEVTGNGDLTYPVGLLTADDIYAAGGYAADNLTYYLYIGYPYCTMSPIGFDGYSFVRSMSSDGNMNNLSFENEFYGVRPVLNLKSGSLTGGSGTATDPYLGPESVINPMPQ